MNFITTNKLHKAVEIWDRCTSVVGCWILKFDASWSLLVTIRVRFFVLRLRHSLLSPCSTHPIQSVPSQCQKILGKCWKQKNLICLCINILSFQFSLRLASNWDILFYLLYFLLEMLTFSWTEMVLNEKRPNVKW